MVVQHAAELDAREGLPHLAKVIVSLPHGLE